MTDSGALRPSRGQTILEWKRDALAESAGGGFVLSARPIPPVDAMRGIYLEAELRSPEALSARLEWENQAGERCGGLALPTAPTRVFLRDHPRWQGPLPSLRLSAPASFEVVQFTLYGDRDLTPAEKFAWPSDFALVPKRRVLAPGESAEARLLVPNRFLRILGDNSVVFTLESARGHVFAEKRVPGRSPLEPWGMTDLFSGALPVAGLSGDARMRARLSGSGTDAVLEETVSLYIAPHTPIPHFAEPYHYLRDFALARIGETCHLYYTVGPADARQDLTSPRAARQFGHATSLDMLDWSLAAPILPVERYNEAETHILGPAIAEHADRFHLYYTARDAGGQETIAAAASNDLREWTRVEQGPVYRPNPAWAARNAPCRTPSLLRHGDIWILYLSTQVRDGRACVAAAVSTDLTHWVDTGPVLITDAPSDSPACIARQDRCFLFTDLAGAYASDDPLRGWRPIEDPRPPGWRGWRFVEIGGEWCAMAYRDLTRGNYAQLFPVRFLRGPGSLPEFDTRFMVMMDD